MKGKLTFLMVCVTALAIVWGMGSTCLADNAAQVVIQVSYPSGNDYVCFYHGSVGDIDATKKDNYVNVHVTLLDANGQPATAGPNGEALAGVTATLTTELGVAGSIVEDQFLSDSADLTFDVVDVGPAARAHVKYACTTGCEPGTDTLEVTVDSLTASAEVEVKAPPASKLYVRTLRVPGVRPTNLFEDMTASTYDKSNNAGIPALAGDSIYFEVWAVEENDGFTTAPELEGVEVTVSAYANFNANAVVGETSYEEDPVATQTAVMSNGVATGYIKIEKAGTTGPSGATNLQVVLTAEVEDGVKTDVPVLNPSTKRTIDTVGMVPRIKNKLLIGTDPSGVGNLISEKNTWYVLDDNSAGPTPTSMTVFVADQYGNPVTGETVQMKAGITGPIADAGKSLVDADGELPTTPRAGSAWDISNSGKGKTGYLKTVQSDAGNNQQEATGGGTANRGKPLQATLTLQDENSLLTADTATVYLVRWSQTAPSSLDLHLDTDKPQTTVTAGDTVTLYITDASGSSGNPTTSEIVEYNDELTINVAECTSGTALKISRSNQGFDQATDEGLSLKAPAPDPTNKSIQIPIKIWGDCKQAQVRSLCVTLTDTSKGIEDIPLYSLPGREIADLQPAGETKVKITELPAGVEAEDLNAEPVVITSEMLVGTNSLLTPASVDTADDYGNIYDDTPSYGITSNVGVATVDATRAASITFDDEDVGKTATVTVSVPGVGTRQLQITNIVEAAAATALMCTLEGPPVPTPGGEAIIQVKADGTFSPSPRNVRISIDQDASVADSQLRDFSGIAYADATTDESLTSGEMVRLVVSAPAQGVVTVEVGDVSGSSTLLETGTCTIPFAIDEEDPVATISPANGSTVQPTAEIEITVTDNVGVNLGGTAYSIEKDGTDITGDLECTTSGDGTTEGTITCAKSGGGLDEGSYSVEVTPKDLAGRTGAQVTSNFTVALCTPVVTIDPESATLYPGETQQFSATTECDGDVTSSAVYSWELSVQGCTGSTIDANGLYTAPSSVTAECTDTVKVTDTVHGGSDTATVTVRSCTPVVSISPSTATLEFGDTQQFTATTKCDGTTVTGNYTWTVTGTAGGTISSTGLYTAGNTAGTDTVKVTDTANQNKTATATVTVQSPVSITVAPDPMLRSRWILLPVMMTIAGDGTSFAPFSSTVTFNPADSVLALFPLVLDAENIWQMIFVMPSWLAGAEDETLTVTVTTGSESVSDEVEIEMLPFILDEQKSQK